MSVQTAVGKAISSLNVGPSGWKFVTSAGASLSVGTPIAHLGINGEGGVIYLSRGSERARLNYGAWAARLV